MPKTSDIAVLGATAAGYVAAATLAKKGHKVIVLACPASPTESPLADWLPADVLATCRLLRQVKSSAAARPFRAVRFHSADLARQSIHRSRAAAGFVLLRPRLLKALAAAARQAGARCVRLRQKPRINLQETVVVLNERASPPREFRAAVLLIAQGGPSEVVADLAIPARAVPTGQMTVCGLDVPLPPSLQKRMDKAMHVVALAGSERFGMFFQVSGVLHVRIVCFAGSPSDEAAELTQLVRHLQRGDLLPEKLNLSRAAAAVWHPPGGAALEMETHLAKRTLLIGTAGGFASAMTGATLDASIRSAMVAADVANRALRSDRLQDTLAEYADQWRDTLADRIRRPGTPMRMMLPVALANKAMTTRFARAFLCGESI